MHNEEHIHIYMNNSMNLTVQLMETWMRKPSAKKKTHIKNGFP